MIQQSRVISIPPQILSVQHRAPAGTGTVPWWLAGGATGAVAVYQPKGAVSQAASKVNLVSPGTYDMVDGGMGAPGWDSANGWILSNALVQNYTAGTLTLDETFTLMVRYVRTGGNYTTIVSTDTSSPYMFIGDSGTNMQVGNDGQVNNSYAASLGSGVYGMAGHQPYRNGVSDGATIGGSWGGSPSGVLTIGFSGNFGFHIEGSIQALGVWNNVLSSGQMAEVAAAMAAFDIPTLALDSTHAWQFTVDGVDVTDYVEPTSVAMTDAEGSEVDTLYIELVDTAGALSLSDWQEIDWIIDPGAVDELVWFGGFVVNAERSAISGGQGMVWRVKCEGYITLLARLPAGLRSWVDAYPGDIVVDLLDQAGLTSQESEQGVLSYEGNDTTTAQFEDLDQDFETWKTTSGDAGYAVVVTNTDATISWGYIGDVDGSSSKIIDIYSDLALTTRGWNGVLPVAGSKTPESYHVRRAELFSGHRPIDTTNVQTGDNALLSFGTTADETVAQVIARLGKQLGWVWRVDGLAQLYFGEATADPAPFNVSDGANATYVDAGYFPARADTVTISGANGMEIRNRVVIHGGAKPSSETQETFIADGVTRIYQLDHRNLLDITVLVNGVVVADGTVWWNTFGDRIVLVNYAEGWIWFVEEFLANEDGITVIYRYWIGLEYEQRDEASIAQRRQVFTYELSDPSITSEERAQEVATQILADYSGSRYTGSFEVWRLGLRAGQDIKLKFAQFDIDTGFTICKMDCRIDPSNTGLVVYCEFGSRQMQLSQAVVGGSAATSDLLRLGQIGAINTSTGATIAKPLIADTALAKQYTAVVDASSNDIDLRLPPALTRIGNSIRVIRIDKSAYNVLLIPAGAETINGSADYDIPNTGYVSILCYSDGSAWYAL